MTVATISGAHEQGASHTYNLELPLSFDHFDIIRYETNFILNLKTRMSCFLQHEAALAFISRSASAIRQRNDQELTLLRDVRLDVWFRGVDRNMCKATNTKRLA